MHLHELKSYFLEHLADYYPKTEIQSFFYHLCDFKLNLKRIDITLNSNKNLSTHDVPFFNEAIKRLKKYEPIQYIIGRSEFYNLIFKVDSHVLIPRPETEELVAWVLNDAKKTSQSQKLKTKSALNILDIGTGSGCIAIALAKNLPNAKVWALDVSKEALKIARFNADLNKVNINFIEADILNPNFTNLVKANKTKQSHTNKKITSKLLNNVKFDIIVSNPPYVKQDEKTLMKPNVLDYEPHLALFVENNNPLLFYEKIANFALNNLVNKGQLYFEINQVLGNNICTLLNTRGFKNSVLKKDIFDVDRMVRTETVSK